MHRARLTAAERAAWDAAAYPEAARFGDDVVHELPTPDADWRDRYVAAPARVTFAGTPLGPLPAGSAAELRLAGELAVTRRGNPARDGVGDERRQRDLAVAHEPHARPGVPRAHVDRAARPRAVRSR